MNLIIKDKLEYNLLWFNILGHFITTTSILLLKAGGFYV
mgnify:CR=1 FL=1